MCVSLLFLLCDVILRALLCLGVGWGWARGRRELGSRSGGEGARETERPLKSSRQNPVETCEAKRNRGERWTGGAESGSPTWGDGIPSVDIHR